MISHTPVCVEASREYSSHTRSSFVGRAHQSHRCCWATSWSSSVSGTADEKTTNDHWLPRLQHVKHLNIPQRSEGRSGQRLSSKKHRTLNQVFKLFSQFLVRTSGIRKHVWGVLWGTFFFFFLESEVMAFCNIMFLSLNFNFRGSLLCRIEKVRVGLKGGFWLYASLAFYYF